MSHSSQIKPISYLKANSAAVLHQLTEERRPLIITQNGEAKAVIQDIVSYDETQKVLALLKILALGSRETEHGKLSSVADVVTRLRTRKTQR
jgi:prevent-host-death family protein